MAEVVSLAERLKARRTELGLSQSQAARELDVARTAYRLWEMEAARPSPDRWRLISHWLGVSVTTMLMSEELLSEEEASRSRSAETIDNAGPRDWDSSGANTAGDFFEQARSLIAEGTEGGYLTSEQSQELALLVARIEEQRGQDTVSHPWEAAELRKKLRLSKDAPKAARDVVAAVAAGIPQDSLDAACLLTSELVTSSVIYGSGRPGDTVRLNVEVNRTRLRVEVSERPSGTPENQKIGLADSGYRLAIVEALASRWSRQPENEGVLTWFELDLPTPGTSEGSRLASPAKDRQEG